MQPESTLRGLSTIVRSRDAEERLRASARSFLRDAGVEERDVEQLALVGPDRLLVYRKLVFNRFVSAVEMSIPRTVARLGSARFREDVSRFLEEAGSRSPYLRDIAVEFVAWAVPLWAGDSDIPNYMPDLARHELLSFEIASMPQDPKPEPAGELDLERGVLFQQAARIVHYDHAVHTLPADEDDRTVPSRERTSLLAYRDDSHRVRFLELGPVAAEVLTELLDRRTPLREAITRGCAAANTNLDDEILGGMATLLADLAERGVLIGPAKA